MLESQQETKQKCFANLCCSKKENLCQGRWFEWLLFNKYK